MNLRSMVLLLGLLGALGGRPAAGHVFEITDVLAVLKSDGDYWVDITADVDALLLGVSPATPSDEVAAQIRGLSPAELDASVADLRTMLQRRVRVRFDGAAGEPPLVTFPEHGTPYADRPGLPSVFGITIRLAGRAPDGAQTFSFTASRAFNATRFTLVDQSSGRSVMLPLAPGEESPAFHLGPRRGADSQPAGGVGPGPAAAGEPAGDTLGVAAGDAAGGEFDAPAAPGGDDRDQRPFYEPNRRDVIGRYLVLGFEHILPKGLDHILFVLGLFLLSTRVAPLLWQVTAFTLAHTITLGLAVTGFVELPARLVEPLIALSIAYVAIENVLTSELKPWRPVVVFLFGLLHGLGFAGVLQDLGLPRGELAAALLSFNVGVELGQLAVILLAFALLGWARPRRFYRAAVVIPLSVAIAAAGLYWAFERTVFGV